MIFAALDLLQYRLRLQHYGDDPSKNILALGHTGRIAEETLKVLAEGDMVICQRMNSLLSWAIMYFGGRYAVDHVAIYIGDGKVLHATLSGVKVHSIHALARGARVLPFRMHGLDEDDLGFRPRKPKSDPEHLGVSSEKAGAATQSENVLDPHLQLLLAGMEIVLGLRPTSFSWRYYFDLAVVAALLDFVLWPINQFPMVSTIWSAWLLVLIRMRIRFQMQRRSGRKFERDSHAGLAMLHMMNQGGHIFPSQPVKGRWKVRILPVWTAPSSRRQRETQSQSQQSGQGNSACDQ